MDMITKQQLRKKKAVIALRTIFSSLAVCLGVLTVFAMVGVSSVEYLAEILLGATLILAVLGYSSHRRVRTAVSVGDYDAEQVVLRLRAAVVRSRTPQEQPERLVPFAEIAKIAASHARPQARFGDGLSGSLTGWWPTLYFLTKQGDVYTMPLYGAHRQRAQRLLSHGLPPYRDGIDIQTSVAHVLNEEKLSVSLDLPQSTVHDDYPTKIQVAKRTKVYLIVAYGAVGLLALVFILGLAFPDSEPIQAVFQPVFQFFLWLGDIGESS